MPPVSPPRPIRRRTAENQTTNQNYDETATDQNYDEMASLPTPRTILDSNQQAKIKASSTVSEKTHIMVKLSKLENDVLNVMSNCWIKKKVKTLI